MAVKEKVVGACTLSLSVVAGEVSCGDLHGSLVVTLFDASASMNRARLSSLVTPIPASVPAQSTMYSLAWAPSFGGLLLEHAQRIEATRQVTFFMVCSGG